MLRAAKKASCSGFRIGVESGAAVVLRKIKRGSTTEKFEKVVQWAVDLGMTPVCGFMVPHYNDTPQTVEQTKQFIQKLASMGAMTNVTLTTPFPGSSLHRHPGFYGLDMISTNWDEYDVRTPTFATKHFSRDEIAEMFAELENLYLANAAKIAKSIVGKLSGSSSSVNSLDVVGLVRGMMG